jgi:hypothetical protein
MLDHPESAKKAAWVCPAQVQCPVPICAHRKVLVHPVEYGAVGLADWSEVEASHLRQVLVLVVRRDALQEVDVLCAAQRTQTVRQTDRQTDRLFWRASITAGLEVGGGTVQHCAIAQAAASGTFSLQD